MINIPRGVKLARTIISCFISFLTFLPLASSFVSRRNFNPQGASFDHRSHLVIMSSSSPSTNINNEGVTSDSSSYRNFSSSSNIATYDGDDSAKATDFANYFCAYAQLYHQKQMLTDHNRMAAYHAAIVGNSDVFKDKVVMDVGTGSGILAGEFVLLLFCFGYFVC